mmetsp:Transcript_389/g.734  ORF Transcript_389/g.734 Transcript_389/m.734 type:complete len:265 (-) Transcript_389:455-1249(-)
MSDDDTEWTVHTSQRSRRPTPATATATVTPARKPEAKPKTLPKPNPEPKPKTAPKSNPPARKPEPEPKQAPNPTSAVATAVDAEQVVLVPSTISNRPNKDSNKSSVDSMTDDDCYTKTVKDFVPASKLVPITNNVTSNDIDAFRRAVLDGLVRLSSRCTHEVALTGGYAFLVEKELNYQIRINDPLAKLPVPQPKPVRPTDETFTAMKTFRHEILSWRMEHECNLDARALLDKKFPGILNPLCSTSREHVTYLIYQIEHSCNCK